MKYLIYTTCFVTPHLETDLEIAKGLIDNGNEVKFLICNRELSRCFANPTNNFDVCSICISKTKNALKHLGLAYESCYFFDKEDEDNIDFSISSIEDLKNFKYKDCEIGLSVLSNLISFTRNHKFDINDYKDFISNGIYSAIKVYKGSLRILNIYKPDIVYFFNGRFLENRPMLHVCSKMGITFYTHERGSSIKKYILTKNNLPHSLLNTEEDIQRVWNVENDFAKKIKIANKFFQNRRHGKIQNWYSFINKQRKNTLPINFNYAKKNIAIFNTSLDEYVTIPDFNNLIYNDDNDAIFKIVNEFISDPSIHFFLRMHPNLSGLKNAQVEELNQICSKFNNITLINPDSEIDSYALMENCDIILTMGSTMGIEALYWKKPSILIGRAYYENIIGILRPNSHNEVVNLINSTFYDIDNSDSLKFGYWSSVFGINYNYFKATDLISGNFLGKRITASFSLRIFLKIKYFLNSLFL